MNLRPPGYEILARCLLRLTSLTRFGLCRRLKRGCNFAGSILRDRYKINKRIRIKYASFLRKITRRNPRAQMPGGQSEGIPRVSGSVLSEFTAPCLFFSSSCAALAFHATPRRGLDRPELRWTLLTLFCHRTSNVPLDVRKHDP